MRSTSSAWCCNTAPRATSSSIRRSRRARSAGLLEGLGWKEVSGKGHIATYIVIEDGRLNRRMPDQPYNLAMVTLDEDPTVNFYSNLPGTPPYEVPVGAAVEVTFEEVAPGQLIHEWRVVEEG